MENETPFGACAECGELLTENEAPHGVCENCAVEDEVENKEGDEEDFM